MIMDAHIWPSLYPAIIVGLFVSFSFGPFSLLRSVVGAIAGLVGGALAYHALQVLEVSAGPIATAVTFGTSALVALIILKILDRTAHSKTTNS